MGLGSGAPPEPRSRDANHPTLLFSWWATLFSAALITIRISGRKVRSNAFFMEDKVMALAMIPLFIRMALIHVVLQNGTNNVDTAGLTDDQIANRELGSKLVLAARIFFAMFIWMSKFTVSEFLRRTFNNTWRRSYEIILRGIRIFLVVTFVAVVIATLAECQPFTHYWQVIPDPGPKCRQGYAQLITMGVCDIITDILLVAFPVPVILLSSISKGRKACLILLFSVSLLLVGVTATRVPKVIEALGRQQYRTVWASIEILVSTFVSNAVIVGSFARDKGTKKNKFRSQSVADSMDRNPVRRPTLVSNPANSEEDLFRQIGCRMPGHLLQEEDDPFATPAKSIRYTDDPNLEQGKAREEEEEEEEGGFADIENESPRGSRRWDRSTAISSPQQGSRTFGIQRENTSDLAAFLRATAAPSPRLDTSSPFFTSTHRLPNLDATSPTQLVLGDAGGLLLGEPSLSPTPDVAAIGRSSSSGPLAPQRQQPQTTGSATPAVAAQDFAGSRPSRSRFRDLSGLLGGVVRGSSTSNSSSRTRHDDDRSRHSSRHRTATTPSVQSRPGSMDIERDNRGEVARSDHKTSALRHGVAVDEDDNDGLAAAEEASGALEMQKVGRLP